MWIDQLQKPLGPLFSLKARSIIAKDRQPKYMYMLFILYVTACWPILRWKRNSQTDTVNYKFSRLLNMNWQKQSFTQNKGKIFRSTPKQRIPFRAWRFISTSLKIHGKDKPCMSLCLIFQAPSCVCLFRNHMKTFSIGTQTTTFYNTSFLHWCIKNAQTILFTSIGSYPFWFCDLI